MNNFVKFPLVLGIVGLICTGALTIVYEVTKEKSNGKENSLFSLPFFAEKNDMAHKRIKQ